MGGHGREEVDLISAKRVTAGVASTQWLGQMSSDAQQQLPRDEGFGQMEPGVEI